MAMVAPGEDASCRHAGAHRDDRRHRARIGATADSIGAEIFPAHVKLVSPESWRYLYFMLFSDFSQSFPNKALSTALADANPTP
jgi:hypothetical protein